MPNWCECDLTVTGPVADLDRFQAGFVKSTPESPDEGEVDFNFIIPMPKELEGTQSDNYGMTGHPAWYGDASQILEYPWVKEAGVTTVEQLQAHLLQKDPQYKEAADRYQSNIEAYGYPTWYEWAVANWGTKWNGVDVTLSRFPELLELSFATAWSPPEPVIEKAAGMFPTLEFDLRYYEGAMGFHGVLQCEGGVVKRQESGDYYGDRGG